MERAIGGMILRVKTDVLEKVKRVIKGEQARDEMVKDVKCQVLCAGVEVRRWLEYFEKVLNVADVREANIKVVGNWQMPVLGKKKKKCLFK